MTLPTLATILMHSSPSHTVTTPFSKILHMLCTKFSPTLSRENAKPIQQGLTASQAYCPITVYLMASVLQWNDYTNLKWSNSAGRAGYKFSYVAVRVIWFVYLKSYRIPEVLHDRFSNILLNPKVNWSYQPTVKMKQLPASLVFIWMLPASGVIIANEIQFHSVSNLSCLALGHP